MMKKSLIGIILVSTLLVGLSLAKEEAPKARSLAVFKNGLGFVIRTADVPLKEGWGEVAFIPKATLGCFWLFPSTPKALVEIARAGWRKEQDERECRNLSELLKINTGKRVRLHLGGAPTIEGELLAMASKPEEAEQALPLIHLKTKEGSVTTLPQEQVSSIEWLDGYQRRLLEDKKSKVLQVKVRNAGSSEPLNMAYLTHSISWLPGYWIDVQDAAQARIILKATLLNDLEDFKDLDVSFVVGYPSFVFSRLTSPMNLEEQIEGFLSRLSGRSAEGNAFANISTQAIQVGGYALDGSNVNMETDVDVEAAGQGAEDLFFFEQKQVTLQKGERAEYTIFSTTVPYEHVFECSLEDISGIDEWGNRRSQNDRDRGSKPPVWHCLKLTNSSQYPWTTGPALAMKGDTPLAQNQLNYVARGATGLLRLTYAPDIAVQQGESETGRKDDVVINRNSYTEVQVAGTVSLKNHKKEAVKMEVSKKVSGAVLAASDGAKTTRTTDEIRGVNPQTLIRWNISLAPGEAKKLTYKYKVYVD